MALSQLCEVFTPPSLPEVVQGVAEMLHSPRQLG